MRHETRLVRADGEGPASFLARLTAGPEDERRAHLPRADGPPLQATLFRGDIDVPAGSQVYVVFPERLTGTLAASDLLS